MLQFIRMHFGRRRAAFLFHYLLARADAKSIKRLLPIVEKAFDNPWVTRVELNIRFSPGGETTLKRLWRLFQSRPGSDLMSWDAPVTVAVFRKRKGKERQALCMSLYIRSGVLYIGQLQGVAGTEVPEELRPWANVFIETCKKFARQQGLREVRVPKASTLASYPTGRSEALTEGQEKALARIRRNMELLYDSNASHLGMAQAGDWFRWQNPSTTQVYQPTAWQRVAPLAASLTLMATLTAILSELHGAQTEPHHLVFFYLLPLSLISMLCAEWIAMLSAGVALLCADYFLQDPLFSFYTSEWRDLIWFAVLAALEIKMIQKLFPRGNSSAAQS